MLNLMLDYGDPNLNMVAAHQNQSMIAPGDTKSSRAAVIRIDERKYFQICGMDKREIFQKSIMPVIKTLAQSDSKVREVVQQIIQIIIDNNQVVTN